MELCALCDLRPNPPTKPWAPLGDSGTFLSAGLREVGRRPRSDPTPPPRAGPAVSAAPHPRWPPRQANPPDVQDVPDAPT